MSLVLQKRPLLLPVIAFAVTGLVVGWTYRLGRDDQEGSQVNSTGLDNVEDRACSKEEGGCELPSHVRREIHKTERRHALRSWLTMKEPMYDNITMLEPNGANLGTISIKKANWYIKKDLADWTDATKTSIRLNFTPRGRETHPGQKRYNNSIKENRCVVCGESEAGYARHYIVPYVYRSLFPYRYKSHMPHDIVILCPDCHVEAERNVHIRRNALEATARRKARLSKDSARPVLIDRKIRGVKRAAATLLQFRDKLPEQRVHDLETRIRKSHWFWELAGGKGDSEPPLDEHLLQQAQTLEDEVPNPEFVPGPQLVVDSLHGDIAGFVKEWRRHFVELMGPRYLPNAWSVDAPVVSDVRTRAVT